MVQIGNRRFVDIPGDPNKIFELPPLLIAQEVTEDSFGEEILSAVERDGLIELPDNIIPNEKSLQMLEMARFDLANNLGEKYTDVIRNWYLGEFILEWIRQCEITFSHSTELKKLIHPDIWPRADRKNIATLLTDKSVCEEEELQSAIGVRISYRILPPVKYFSDHYLFYIGPIVHKTAYNAWASSYPAQIELPPERFHFEVQSI